MQINHTPVRQNQTLDGCFRAVDFPHDSLPMRAAAAFRAMSVITTLLILYTLTVRPQPVPEQSPATQPQRPTDEPPKIISESELTRSQCNANLPVQRTTQKTKGVAVASKRANKATAHEHDVVWLTTQDLADYIQTPEATIRTWRARGTIGPRAYRLGRIVKYKLHEVEAWIESRSRDSLESVRQ